MTDEDDRDLDDVLAQLPRPRAAVRMRAVSFRRRATVDPEHGHAHQPGPDQGGQLSHLAAARFALARLREVQ